MTQIPKLRRMKRRSFFVVLAGAQPVSTTADHDWVLYDGECQFCLNWIRRVERTLKRQGIATAPQQAPWAAARLNIPAGTTADELKVLLHAGGMLGGIDAVLFIARHVWWLFPLRLIAVLPGGKRALAAFYRRVATQRHCQKSCDVRS